VWASWTFPAGACRSPAAVQGTPTTPGAGRPFASGGQGSLVDSRGTGRPLGEHAGAFGDGQCRGSPSGGLSIAFRCLLLALSASACARPNWRQSRSRPGVLAPGISRDDLRSGTPPAGRAVRFTELRDLQGFGTTLSASFEGARIVLGGSRRPRAGRPRRTSHRALEPRSEQDRGRADGLEARARSRRRSGGSGAGGRARRRGLHSHLKQGGLAVKVEGILDLSGNASEWTDDCSGNSNTEQTCAVRGGSVADGARVGGRGLDRRRLLRAREGVNTVSAPA
jgi:hypothetical protein